MRDGSFELAKLMSGGDVPDAEVVQKLGIADNLRESNEKYIARLTFLNEQLKKNEAKQITNLLKQETKEDRQLFQKLIDENPQF